jgi:GntR family transcriptional regulator, transcriptional repressor for pyruvate dehydrogenase complex
VVSEPPADSSALVPFAPLADTTRSDAVASRLSDAIKLGLIGDGAQLPAEAELAAQLGVATVTLRNALASLRSEGLIETRRGRGGGSFVRLPPDTSLESLRERLRAFPADELRDVGDYRLAVSGASASLAAIRASPFELKGLEKRVAKLAPRSVNGALRRGDSRFHIRLAAASHSTRLARAEIVIQSEIGEFLQLLLEHEVDRERATSEHRAVLEAVGAGDGEKARALMEMHVAADTAGLIDLHIALARAGAG